MGYVPDVGDLVGFWRRCARAAKAAACRNSWRSVMAWYPADPGRRRPAAAPAAGAVPRPGSRPVSVVDRIGGFDR
jgi:hypothetical protein